MPIQFAGPRQHTLASPGTASLDSLENLSEFWRFDRSNDRVLELASVLQGADLLIGNMGSSLQVQWSGQQVSFSDLEKGIVSLDYSPLKCLDAPFDGAAVDEVIGYAAHEGGHCLWSAPGKELVISARIRLVWDDLPASFQQEWLADKSSVLSQIFRCHNILEDAYIDHNVADRWPVLGEYIRTARGRLESRANFNLDQVAGDPAPDRESVINLWACVSLYGGVLPANTSERVRHAMSSLAALDTRSSVEEKPRARQQLSVDAAIVLWREFSNGGVNASVESGSRGSDAGESSPGEEQGQGVGGPDRMDGVSGANLSEFDPSPSEGGSGRRVEPAPEDLLESLAIRTEPKTDDLSDLVAVELAEDPNQISATSRLATYDPELADELRSRLQPQIREMQHSISKRQDKTPKWRRGQESGKLDTRSLWKLFAGSRSFMKRRDTGEWPKLHIGLLMDVSASIRKYMSLIEETAAVFCYGLSEVPDVDISAMCYTGHSGRVTLTRLWDRQNQRLCLGDLETGGRTPSGAAVSAAKITMARLPARERILLHFTDGEPDNLAHLSLALEACASSGVKVYAIGPSRYSKMLAAQYGEGNYQTIESISGLPEAVKVLTQGLKIPRA